jgi:hypothetical protein
MSIRKKISEKLNLIEHYVLSKTVKDPVTLFEVNPQGFEKARKWAKSKPHPFIKGKTLWDYARNWEFDSFLTLHVINLVALEYVQKKTK